jgi:hypothetical protein
MCLFLENSISFYSINLVYTDISSLYDRSCTGLGIKYLLFFNITFLNVSDELYAL